MKHRRDPKHAEKISAWREAVLERDEYRCVVCGRGHRETNLTAHHMLPRSYARNRIYDPNNGITLCQGAGCRGHDRAHLLARPYIYCWFDGQRVKWSEDASQCPPRRLIEEALANASEPC